MPERERRRPGAQAAGRPPRDTRHNLRPHRSDSTAARVGEPAAPARSRGRASCRSAEVRLRQPPSSAHAATNRPRIARKLRSGWQWCTHPQPPSGVGPSSHAPPRSVDRLHCQRSPSRSGVHSRQGRAVAAGRRPGRAGLPLAREPAHPRLVRPLVLAAVVIGRRLPHAAPPSNACANRPCRIAPITSMHVSPMCTNSHSFSSPCRASWKSRSSFRRTSANSRSQAGLLLVRQISPHVLHLAHQRAPSGRRRPQQVPCPARLLKKSYSRAR